MFKSAIIRLILAVFTVLFIFSQEAVAQYEAIGTQELKISALAEFNSGNYSSSLNSYNELIIRYPKDGVFNYYSGRCLLKMNKTIPIAVSSLKFASGRPNVPSDVNYYLGEAYMQNYQFSEAKIAYSQFIEVATKIQLKELDPQRKAEIAANAIVISGKYNPAEIITSSLFTFQDPAYINKIANGGGVLGYKSNQLRSSLENVEPLSVLCFIHKDPVKGEYLYYSGYGRNTKRGSDLYRVMILDGDKFSEPELLTTLSSNFNDILPYFEPAGKAIYFASQGHSGMGGYDVFKSQLNQDNNTWSKPENLGFPVNSPSDEYIFLPGSDPGTVLLITDRQGLDSMLTAYILRIKEPEKSLENADNEQLKRIGGFGGIESIPDIIDIAKKGIPPKDSLKTSSNVRPAEPRPVIRKDLQSSAGYTNNVKMALDFQFRSDSLARLAREARIKVRSMPDPNQRWAIQSNIISWEKQSLEYQAKADVYYGLIRKLESGKSPEPKVPVAIRKDTTINDLVRYKFNPTPDVPVVPVKKTDTAGIAGKVTKVLGKPAGEVKPLPKTGGGGNQFEVLNKTTGTGNKQIQADIPIPSGAFYRIQLGVFSRKVGWDTFGGLSPITSESIPGKAMTRYYAGKFTSIESAKSALNTVKSRGIKDSFIIGWYNGKKLAVDKVVEFEKRDVN